MTTYVRTRRYSGRKWHIYKRKRNAYGFWTLCMREMDGYLPHLQSTTERPKRMCYYCCKAEARNEQGEGGKE